MDAREREFRKRLLATFRSEASERLRELDAGLDELAGAADGPGRMRVVETVFRAVHSLKGAARAVNAADVELVCHSTENLLAALKRGALQASADLVDLLHQAADNLARQLDTLGTGDGAEPRHAISELLSRLEQAARGVPLPTPPASPRIATTASSPAVQREAKPVPPAPPSTEERPVVAQTVRIEAAQLASLLLQLEEMLGAKLAATALAAQAHEALDAFAALRRRSDHSVQRRERLRGGAASVFDADAGAVHARMQALAARADADARALGGMVDALLADLKQALMLPISTVLEPFPKLVRDLCRDQGKQADLDMHGGETQVDRRILEEMRDPLVHLLRNSVDHGIEPPEARERQGKPARGRITLTVRPRDGGQLEIVLADDGPGIDVDRLRAAARAAGALQGAEDGALAEADLLMLAFESGISTRAEVTDVSGRGLGLAIVAEKVERLGGSVRIESRPGEGAAFRIIVPLTLATFRGIHVRVRDERFVLPTARVRQVGRVKRESVRTLEGRPAIAWNGEVLALVSLCDALAMPSRAAPAGEWVHFVIAGSGKRSVAFAVDEVLGEQEVLVKSLGKLLPRVPNVTGATVLATGKPVPIVHVPDLLRAAGAATWIPFEAAVGARGSGAARKSILVAEDSVTSRALLKNILETAGYRVVTATDGLDAIAKLRDEPFDLVVSDVEMPRLDGFDLTARIRRDARLSRLPVVLVTALASNEDRERGADAGANAYIVKGGFDQDSLLEAVGRLA